jgi:hypothetical protein
MGGMLLTMLGNPSAALAAPAAAAAAAGFGAIFTHEASDVPLMLLAPNELMVVSAFTGLDMPRLFRNPPVANGEPGPIRAVGLVPRPRKLRMLDGPEVDDVDAAVDDVDAAVDARGEASD